MSDQDIGHLDFAPDAEAMLNHAAVALVALHACREALHGGSLELLERAGRCFRVVSGNWPLGFGLPTPWDPATDATAVVTDLDGRPIAVIDSNTITRA